MTKDCSPFTRCLRQRHGRPESGLVADPLTGTETKVPLTSPTTVFSGLTSAEGSPR